MATSAYWGWINSGRPWRKARPVAEMEAWARANGIAVLGTIGNEAHLQASWPEDHTPFSFTAWPDPLPGYVVTAIDLANVRGLGEAILRDARAGKLGWLKYMNAAGWNYTFADRFQRGRANSDQHVHLSIFSDETETSIGGYDPLATGEDDMALTDQDVDRIAEAVAKRPNPSNKVALGTMVRQMFERRGDAGKALTEVAALRKQGEAILSALAGSDTAAILALIDRRSVEEVERDLRAATERAELARRLDGQADVLDELRRLVESWSSGQRDAVEVVRLMGEAMAAIAAPPAPDGT